MHGVQNSASTKSLTLSFTKFLTQQQPQLPVSSRIFQIYSRHIQTHIFMHSFFPQGVTYFEQSVHCLENKIF